MVVVIGTWTGSLIQLMLGVSSLFRQFPGSSGSLVAVEGAPALFNAAEQLHLGFAAASIVVCWGWRQVACSRLRQIIFWTLLSAGVVATLSTVFISSHINELRLSGLSQTAKFKQYHAASSVAYLAQFGLVISSLIMTAISISRAETVPACELSDSHTLNPSTSALV